MKLKFFIDQNISPQTTQFLRGLGLSVTDVREAGLLGKSDTVIYRHARKEGAVLITFDHEFAYTFLNKKDLAGLIVLRIHPQTLDQLHPLLRQFFAKITEKEIKGNIVIVKRHSSRIRRVKR